MSAQSILGVIGTATVEVAEVERLVVELEATKEALQRARELAAYCEQLYAEARRLLELTVSPTTGTSHEAEAACGFAIQGFLREVHDLGDGPVAWEGTC